MVADRDRTRRDAVTGTWGELNCVAKQLQIPQERATP